MFEREGAGLEYPGLVITADSASWDDSTRRLAGAERGEPGDRRSRQAGDVHLQYHAAPRADPVAGGPAGRGEGARRDALRGAGPLHRRAAPLGERRQQADQWSGPLKVAIPVTCFIIALFGAPLAVTNPRAGAAVGIAISLGTTVLFLLLTQIMKAVGAGGVVDPTDRGVVAQHACSVLAALLLHGAGEDVRRAAEPVVIPSEARDPHGYPEPGGMTCFARADAPYRLTAFPADRIFPPYDHPPPRHRRYGHRRALERMEAGLRRATGGSGHQGNARRQRQRLGPGRHRRALWVLATAPASTRPTPWPPATAWPTPKPFASSQVKAPEGFTSFSLWALGSIADPTGGSGSGSRLPTPGPGSFTPGATAPARR